MHIQTQLQERESEIFLVDIILFYNAPTKKQHKWKVSLT